LVDGFLVIGEMDLVRQGKRVAENLEIRRFETTEHHPEERIKRDARENQPRGGFEMGTQAAHRSTFRNIRPLTLTRSSRGNEALIFFAPVSLSLLTSAAANGKSMGRSGVREGLLRVMAVVLVRAQARAFLRRG